MDSTFVSAGGLRKALFGSFPCSNLEGEVPQVQG